MPAAPNEILVLWVWHDPCFMACSMGLIEDIAVPLRSKQTGSTLGLVGQSIVPTRPFNRLYRRTRRLPSAESDSLILNLLETINISRRAIDSRLSADVHHLRSVLMADYRQAPGLPSKGLARKLAAIVHSE